jgi:hypothetical protein
MIYWFVDSSTVFYTPTLGVLSLFSKPESSAMSGGGDIFLLILELKLA